MGTSGLRGAPVRSLGAPCVHGTPVFQSRDKDEARKGGLHKTREGGRRGGEKKRGRRCARKKLESRKSKGYRREGEYKARYASQAAVIVGGAGRSERKSYHSGLLRPSSLLPSLSLRMTSPSLSQRTREEEARREDEVREEKRREEKRGGKSPLNDVRSRVVNIRLYGCR